MTPGSERFPTCRCTLHGPEARVTGRHFENVHRDTGLRPARAAIERPVYLVLIVSLSMIHLGCDNRDQTAATATKPGVIIISGDTAGWIVPCGCTANQSGGLLRRGTMVAKLRE